MGIHVFRLFKELVDICKHFMVRFLGGSFSSAVLYSPASSSVPCSCSSSDSSSLGSSLGAPPGAPRALRAHAGGRLLAISAAAGEWAALELGVARWWELLRALITLGCYKDSPVRPVDDRSCRYVCTLL